MEGNLPADHNNLFVANHPLVHTNLTALRSVETGSHGFRAALRDISTLLFIDSSKNLQTEAIPVQTPLATCAGAKLARPIVLIPILRAGIGMLDGILDLVPSASVGHIGLFRDESTHRPTRYYCKLPRTLPEAEVILLDPMLATGHSAAAAVSEIKKLGGKHLRFLCIVSCPEGIKHLHSEHPDLPIHTAVVDEALNSDAYIVPGLGDAGDRYFGTA